jgi:hypothetical protein
MVVWVQMFVLGKFEIAMRYSTASRKFKCLRSVAVSSPVASLNGSGDFLY